MDSQEKQAKVIELLEERKRAEDIIDVDERRIQVVIFSLEDEFYGIYGSHVKGIVPLEAIAPVPGAPDYLLGLTNVRGDVEAVLDLRIIFNIPRNPAGRKNRLVLTRVDDVVCCILVDRVVEVANIPESDIVEASASKAMNELVAGKATYDNQPVIMLDIPKIFNQYLNI